MPCEKDSDIDTKFCCDGEVSNVSLNCGEQPYEESLNDTISTVVSDLIQTIADSDDTQPSFDIYNIRAARSIASIASSDAGDLSAFSDCESSEFEDIKTDEDSDVEFERYLLQTAKHRRQNYIREHVPSLLTKRPKRERKRRDLLVEDEYENLPALEKLSIQCDSRTPLEELGAVQSIVGCIAVIHSTSGVALDLDSVVFDKDRNALGSVFDVFGPVRCPSYCLRFNSNTEAMSLSVGLVVYYAPTKEEYTKKILENNLQGPWKRGDLQSQVSDDEDEIVFSDDEKEKEYRAKKKAARAASNSNRGGDQNATGNGRKRNSNRVQFNVDSPGPQQNVQRGRGRGRGRQQRGGGGNQRGGARNNHGGWNWNQGGGFQNYQQNQSQGWSNSGNFSSAYRRPNSNQNPAPTPSVENDAAISYDNPYAEFLGYDQM